MTVNGVDTPRFAQQRLSYVGLMETGYSARTAALGDFGHVSTEFNSRLIAAVVERMEMPGQSIERPLLMVPKTVRLTIRLFSAGRNVCYTTASGLYLFSSMLDSPD